MKSTKAAEHQVFDTDVGERAARHDAVVAATRAVAVEVGELDAVVGEEFSGGRTLLDRASGRDVVGGDAVAENAERARASDGLDAAGREREVLEERRLLDVGGLAIALIHVADA